MASRQLKHFFIHDNGNFLDGYLIAREIFHTNKLQEQAPLLN